MTTKQRLILVGGALVIFGMMLFPPFIAGAGESRAWNQGFAFILAPPNMNTREYGDPYYATVNVELLALEITAVTLVVGLLYAACSQKGDVK